MLVFFECLLIHFFMSNIIAVFSRIFILFSFLFYFFTYFSGYTLLCYCVLIIVRCALYLYVL